MASDMDIDPFATSMLITFHYNPGAFVKSATSMNERAHTHGTKIFAQVMPVSEAEAQDCIDAAK